MSLYVLAVPSHCSSCLGYSDDIGLVIVIVISLPHYCAMGLSITVFPLDSYSRPYAKKSIIAGSVIFLIIFICLLTNALLCSPSLSMVIGALFIIGIILHVGQLNSSVSGCGSPGHSNIVMPVIELDVYMIYYHSDFSLYVLQVWCILPPNHCFGGRMMMMLHILCLSFCSIFQILANKITAYIWHYFSW